MGPRRVSNRLGRSSVFRLRDRVWFARTGTRGVVERVLDRHHFLIALGDGSSAAVHGSLLRLSGKGRPSRRLTRQLPSGAPTP